MFLMNEYANLVGEYEKDKYEFAGEFILSNINYGFFVYAYIENDQGNKVPAGFMLFTYEWCDWRNGLFFWMQSCHVREEFKDHDVFR